MIKLFNSLQALHHAFEKSPLRRLRIGDKVFCLVRNNDDFHLVEGLCPHQKQPLYEGSLNAFGEIICPLHFYRFNLKTGHEANRLCASLEVYPLTINNQGVFVQLKL